MIEIDKKIAIEFNGTYWHSDATRKDARRRHACKYEACQNNGYQLIQVWSDDWLYKQDVVIRMLAAKLGAWDNGAVLLNDELFAHRYMARNLDFREVDVKCMHEFLDKVHIQGFSRATRHFGLFDGDTLVAGVSVKAPKQKGRVARLDGEWEIVRYGTIGRVVGGFSKLLVNVERCLMSEGHMLTSWLTFSDNCVSNGQLYKTCGFVVDKKLAPDYKYIGASCSGRRVSKELFQKKRFRDDSRLLFDDSMSESELAELNGLSRVWDAGKIRWRKVIS